MLLVCIYLEMNDLVLIACRWNTVALATEKKLFLTCNYDFFIWKKSNIKKVLAPRWGHMRKKNEMIDRQIGYN